MPRSHRTRAMHRALARLATAAVLQAACHGDAHGPTAPEGPAAAPTARATLTPSGEFYRGPFRYPLDSATMARLDADARALGYDTLGPGRGAPVPPSVSMAGAPMLAAVAPTGSFLVDFDGIQGDRVAYQYAALGVYFASAYRIPTSDALPASSGGWGITGPTIGFLGILFFEPVDEVRFVVTSPYAFRVSCEGFRQSGSYGILVEYELPGRSAGVPLEPYPTRETITLTSPGIERCWVRSRGFSYIIDDVQWRRGAGLPSVSLACLGGDGSARVMRGEAVHCRAEVTPGTAFRLLGWASIGADGFSHAEASGELMEAGTAATWSGPAVLDSRITVEIQVPGFPDTLRQTAEFAVTPRAWRTQITGRPRVIFTADPEMPEPTAATAAVDGRFGEMDLWPGMPSYEALGEAGTGPNAAWSYVKQPLPATDPVARVNGRLLAGHEWYRAQDGGRLPGAPRRTCSASDLEALKQQVLEHEGVVSGTRPSHYDVWARELAANDFAPAVERLAIHGPGRGGTEVLAGEVSRIQQEWVAAMDALHFQQVDALDSLVISCSFGSSPSSSGAKP